jgi:serine/threonine protein kinase
MQDTCWQVYIGINLADGTLFAVKDITASPTKDMVETIVREILFLSSFHHDHIVSYLGAELHDSTISIFTEFMPGGSLADIITSFGVLPDHLTARYIRQVTVELSQPPRRCPRTNVPAQTSPHKLPCTNKSGERPPATHYQCSNYALRALSGSFMVS